MEITNEIKAKVFCQYLGKLTTYKVGDEIYTMPLEILNIYNVNSFFSEKKLILKPLSAITDEDAIEVQNILGLKTGIKSKYFFEICNATSPENAIEIYQFLQYRGYDMPHYLLNGQTLEESGLAIYEGIADK